MSERETAAAPPEPPPGEVPSPAARFALLQRAGGITAPILTAILAFFVGGIVVAVTGHNPITTYREIFNGTGLSWFFQVGSHQIGLPWTDATIWFPWNVNDAESEAAFNLQQTLLSATPLIFTGLAVAFAFRCGLFNIGGQGQYIVGAMVAVWVGSSWAGLASGLHIPLAIGLAALAGALWAGIAGFLKAAVGAHEVITTIMLNWIAYWVGSYLFSIGGPLQSDTQSSVPISNDVRESAELPVLWGDVQGLHLGFLLAIAALVVFWLLIDRTTLGYGVRAVGANPEAARYAGINVPRNYFLALAISGAFAGLAGAIDILGWQHRYGQLDIQGADIGFAGIAVALLGRNRAVGIFFASILFGGLLTGTSTRNLNPDVFDPELAGNLTLIIQGLVVLFIGAELIVLWLWRARRRVLR